MKPTYQCGIQHEVALGTRLGADEADEAELAEGLEDGQDGAVGAQADELEEVAGVDEGASGEMYLEQSDGLVGGERLATVCFSTRPWWSRKEQRRSL